MDLQLRIGELSRFALENNLSLRDLVQALNVVSWRRRSRRSTTTKPRPRHSWESTATPSGKGQGLRDRGTFGLLPHLKAITLISTSAPLGKPAT